MTNQPEEVDISSIDWPSDDDAPADMEPVPGKYVSPIPKDVEPEPVVALELKPTPEPTILAVTAEVSAPVVSEVAVAQVSTNLPSAPIGTLMDPDVLRAGLARLAENKKIIDEFVRSQLKEDVDYGRIHISSNCQNRYNPKDCKIAGHFSKPNLFKPGQEKIFALFGITGKIQRDDVTLTMFENKKGLVAYICEMWKDGLLIGEGRGAADISEKNGWTVNSCVKIAEKRARMDACLTLGFSEYFTQDMEDGAIDASGAPVNAAPARRDSRPTPLPAARPPVQTRAAGEVQVITAVIEVSDVAFRKMKTGKEYAIVKTTAGKEVFAWQNTMDDFVVGHKARVQIEINDRGASVKEFLEDLSVPNDEEGA